MAGELQDLPQALDIATGAHARPVNVTASQIGADIRAWQSMSKLGGALISGFGYYLLHNTLLFQITQRAPQARSLAIGHALVCRE